MWKSQQRPFILFFQRSGSDAQPHLFWWFTSQTHRESLGNVSDVTPTARPRGAVRGDRWSTGRMFLLHTRPVIRPRQEFRQQKANKVSVVKQGSPTFPASWKGKKDREEAKTKRQGENQKEKDKRFPGGRWHHSFSELSKHFPEMKHFIIIFVVKKSLAERKIKAGIVCFKPRNTKQE